MHAIPLGHLTGEALAPPNAPTDRAVRRRWYVATVEIYNMTMILTDIAPTAGNYSSPFHGQPNEPLPSRMGLHDTDQARPASDIPRFYLDSEILECPE